MEEEDGFVVTVVEDEWKCVRDERKADACGGAAR